MTVESLHGEIWRDYPEDTRYKVSNMGRVVGCRGHLIKLVNGGDGYLRVNFFFNKKVCYRKVHQMVMNTFDPNGEGECVCHNNGDSLDNRLVNLRRDTMANNLDDRKKHGTLGRNIGERNGTAKLTADKVLAIRELLAAGWSQREVGEHFGVSSGAIGKVARGKTWEHIKD